MTPLELWSRLRSRFTALSLRMRLGTGIGVIVGTGAVWWAMTPGLDGRLMAAERAQYPHGRRFVINHDGLTNWGGCMHGAVHYPLSAGASRIGGTPRDVEWFPDSGVTAASGHAFLFSAWPKGRTPPLEQDLAARGILIETPVPLDRDGRDPDGHRIVQEETMLFYLVRPWDARMTFCTNYAVPSYRPLTNPGSIESEGRFLPSRLSDQTVPDDPGVMVPRQVQWATSQVAGFVVTDTPETLDHAVRRINGDGEIYYTAIVGMRRHLPGWMRTPVFRAAYGGAPGIDPDRLHPVETAFRVQDGRLTWDGERPRLTPGDPE